MIQGHKRVLIIHKKSETILFRATWIKLELASQLTEVREKTKAIGSHSYVESLKYDSTEIKSRSWLPEVGGRGLKGEGNDENQCGLIYSSRKLLWYTTAWHGNPVTPKLCPFQKDRILKVLTKWSTSR